MQALKMCTSISVLFMRLHLLFVKSLSWPLDVHSSKLSFYYNIFSLQYCVWKCRVWIGPGHIVFEKANWSFIMLRDLKNKAVYGPRIDLKMKISEKWTLKRKKKIFCKKIKYRWNALRVCYVHVSKCKVGMKTLKMRF